MSYQRLVIYLTIPLVMSVVPVAQAQEQCPSIEELVACPSLRDLIDEAVDAAKADRQAEREARLAACIAELIPCGLDEEPDISVLPCGSCRPVEVEDVRTFFVDFDPVTIGISQYVRFGISNPCVDGLGRVQLAVLDIGTGVVHRTGRDLEPLITVFNVLEPVEGAPRSGLKDLRARMRAKCEFGIVLGDEFLARLHIMERTSPKPPPGEGKGTAPPFPDDKEPVDGATESMSGRTTEHLDPTGDRPPREM